MLQFRLTSTSHALGLGDLYISSSYNYIYDGNIIDNTDRLMYGFWNWQNLSGTQRIHSNDIFGVQKIHNWASYEHLSQEDLMEMSDIIVSGKVINVQKNIGNSYVDSKYTKVKLLVKDYLYGQNNNDTILEFLQEGTVDSYFEYNRIFNIGDECILYLHYGLDGKLYLTGGPQGRFDVLDNDSIKKVANHMDNYIYSSVESINFKKQLDFIELQTFINATKIKINQYKYEFEGGKFEK